MFTHAAGKVLYLIEKYLLYYQRWAIYYLSLFTTEKVT